LFLPGVPLGTVYGHDAAVPVYVGSDGLAMSSSSAPSIMACMLDQLSVETGQAVLEIGAGSGYNAALLARLVGERGTVTTVDLEAGVADAARRHLEDAGASGVEVRIGDGWDGVPSGAPYDRIEVTVGAWDVSPHWVDQLGPDGILVLPLWLRPGVQASVAFVRTEDSLVSQSVAYCGFMRLRGPHAGPESYVVVPGWADRVQGATEEKQWAASIEDATPDKVDRLRELLSGPVQALPAPRVAEGWTTRLALEEPDVIALGGLTTWWHSAHGLFDPDRRSLALLDGEILLGFGAGSCLERLRARLPMLLPLEFQNLHLKARPHQSAEPNEAGVLLGRENFDLFVTARS
jgi:protein-L-isoaspartate(D-aspartate) O-methyltransferase